MRRPRGAALALGLLAVFLLTPVPRARAQGNFEIQVYGSETVPPRSTLVELHSNVAAQGTTRTENRVRPTQGAFHETRTRDGSGWATTCGRGCARPRAGSSPSA